jgi:RHS repeat-associated protein
VNRMIEAGPLTGSRHHYTYRADGMRVRKDIPGLVEKVYYDGQMPVETFEDFSTGNDKLTRNFVGARGIEMMETTVSGATTQSYPLYDTHGNMVATLSKNTAGTSWSLGNERGYDLWGSVRSGAVTGGPKGRYVANLGHVQDDESGLIYMRARFYEPETGRFVSEDPARRGGNNFYIYSINNPTNFVDGDGYEPSKADWFAIGRILVSLIGSQIFMLTFIAAISAGFLITTSLLWGFFWYIPVALAGIEIAEAGIGAWDMLKDQKKLYPHIYRTDDGIKKYRKGMLVELLGFINGWYALLEILFRNISEFAES